MQLRALFQGDATQINLCKAPQRWVLEKGGKVPLVSSSSTQQEDFGWEKEEKGRGWEARDEDLVGRDEVTQTGPVVAIPSYAISILPIPAISTPRSKEAVNTDYIIQTAHKVLSPLVQHVMIDLKTSHETKYFNCSQWWTKCDMESPLDVVLWEKLWLNCNSRPLRWTCKYAPKLPICDFLGSYLGQVTVMFLLQRRRQK